MASRCQTECLSPVVIDHQTRIADRHSRVLLPYAFAWLGRSQDPLEQKIWMDSDLNKYDTEHAVTAHPHMSREVWETVYADAWKSYYTPQHMETILRRAGATGIGFGRLTGLLLLCAQSEQLEGIHPMQGGILRRKVRTDRRPALGLEARWSFYPKYVIGLLRKTVALGQQAYFLKTVRKRIESDPLAKHYTDVALTPVQDDEFDELELFTHTADAKAAVYQTRKIESRHAAAD